MTIPTRSIGGSLARTASRNFWHKAPGLHAWNSRTAHCICLRTPEILACRGRSEQNPHLHICRASLSPARGVQGAMQISIRVAAERRADSFYRTQTMASTKRSNDRSGLCSRFSHLPYDPRSGVSAVQTTDSLPTETQTSN